MADRKFYSFDAADAARMVEAVAAAMVDHGIGEASATYQSGSMTLTFRLTRSGADDSDDQDMTDI